VLVPGAAGAALCWCRAQPEPRWVYAGRWRGRDRRVGPVRLLLMVTVFESPDDLLGAVGTDLGSSEWLTISQERINLFADATGDHQWIHVDPVAAERGPFGATVAHGYLTLALTNQFLPEIVRVDNASMGINYGTNRVRFPQPVTVGSRVRAGAVLSDAQEVNGGVQAVITITVEIDGETKPACVVESVSRFLR